MATLRRSAITNKRRGRPREFDLDTTLDGAVRVFRERGYSATSISDLEKATDLAAGSLYKAFKDKRTLFLAAYNRYLTKRLDRMQIALEKGRTGLEKLREYLIAYADVSFGKQGEVGCLVVNSAIEIMVLDEEIASVVKATFVRNQNQITKLIRLGQTDSSIPKTVDFDGAAQLILCVVQGMRVVGKLGRTRSEVLRVVDFALKAVA